MFHNGKYVYSHGLAKFTGVIHGISTRRYGNMRHKFRDISVAKRNRSDFLQLFDIDPTAIVMPEIVHGTRIAIVDKSDLGTVVKEVDGLATDVPGVFITTFGADCVPLLAYDPVKRVVGTAHAGWMGTLGLISKRLILLMTKTWGCKPSDIFVYLGPSIGPCHYDQTADKGDGPREENFDLFRNMFPSAVTSRSGVAYIDLWEAHKRQLLSSGVREMNIEISGLCTVCRNDDFYSNHLEGRSREGAIMAFIGLKDPKDIVT